MIKTAAATAITLIALTGCAGTTTATPAVSPTVSTPAPRPTAVFEPPPAAPQAPASARPLPLVLGSEPTSGTFTVGKSLQPGLYKVTAIVPPDGDCNWEIINPPSRFGNNYGSNGLPTVRLKVGQVFNNQGCGTWKKVAAQPAPVNASALTNIAANSTFTVGTDIAPGTYEVDERIYPAICGWSVRKPGATSIADFINGDLFVGGVQTVKLKVGQEFGSRDCGSWTKII